MAIRVNNLGAVMQEQGDLVGARAAFERALTIDKAALEPQNLKVAIDLNNLGGIMQVAGDLAGSRVAYARALAIFEQALGAKHPNTRTVRDNLSSLDTAGV